MGLDMYLHKKTYVKYWDHMKPEQRHNVAVSKNGVPVDHIKPERVSEITEEVGYWRKFNALHNWFVQNCQDGEDDCGEHSVEVSQIKKLIPVLEEIIANPDKAHELLPTQQGFFFGSQNYDEYYFEDVRYTIELFKNLVEEMENTDGISDLYYRSSW